MNIRVLTLVVLPAFAAGCFPDPVTSDETPPAESTFAPTATLDAEGGTPAPLDLTGTWAFKTVITQDVENAFDDTKYDRQTVASYHILTHSAGSGPNEITHENQLCLTELSEVSASIPTLSAGFYPPSSSGALTATLSKAAIGGSYTLPEAVFLRGVNLSNPNAAMPTADDPKTDCDKVEAGYMSEDGVYDYDNDGNPGFITQVVGAVTADLWTIERYKLQLSGTIYSKDLIRGEFLGSLQDVFICSTKPGLVSTEVNIKALTGEEYNFFIMVRVDDGMSCSQMLGQRDQLFP